MPTSAPAGGRPRVRARGEEGFGIVEVLVSALLITLVAVGTFAGLDAASATSGDLKAKGIAAGLVQQDLERMRGMRVQDLSNLRQTQAKTLCDDQNTACTNYTITSRADWYSDQTGAQNCTSSSTRADYLKITSSVTWPGMGTAPVSADSLVAPPNGSFGANQGTLAVQVLKSDGSTPVSGLAVTLSGPAGYTDVTNSQGCVVWGYLPAGNGYTVSFSTAGWVDKDGNQNVSKPASVVGESTSTLSFLYDQAASARLSFYAQIGGQKYANELDDAVTFVQSQMSSSRTFTIGSPAATVSATNLFPFDAGSPGGAYRVYGGNCTGEDPWQQAPPDWTNLDFLSLQPGDVNIDVSDSNSPNAGQVGIRLPAFDSKITVNGSNVTGANNAALKIVQTTTPGCGSPPAWGTGTGTAVLTSGTDRGKLADPGRPYGVYNVCAQATWLVGGVNKTYREVWMNQTLGNASSVTVPPSGGSAGVIDLTTADTNKDCGMAIP